MVLFLTAASFAPYQQVFHRKRLVFQFVRDNAWLITENQGQPEKGELLRDTIVTPYFVLLRFRCVSRIKSYLVMRDSLIDSNLNTLILQLKLTTF